MKPNADITLYHYDGSKYVRQYIEGVFWFDSKQSNVLKSGLVNADRVSIHVPVTSAEILEITTIKDLVIKGDVSIEIDSSTQQRESASLRFLNENYDVFTVNAFDPKLYGSRNMQHYELSCK